MSVNCDFCNISIPEDERDMYSCYMCGYGKSNDKNICDDCTMKHECSRCNGPCCPKCAVNKYNCCGEGIILCGSNCPTYVNDDEELSCAYGHQIKVLKCGHMGCNYYKEGCLICKREGKAEDKINVNNEEDREEEIIELSETEEEEEDDDNDDGDDEIIQVEGIQNLGISRFVNLYPNSCHDRGLRDIQDIEDIDAFDSDEDDVDVYEVDDENDEQEEIVDAVGITNVEEEEDNDENDSETEDEYDENGLDEEEGGVVSVYSGEPKTDEIVTVRNNPGVSTSTCDGDSDYVHDQKLVEAWIKQAKTESLKQHLQSWVLQQSISKKRKLG